MLKTNEECWKVPELGLKITGEISLNYVYLNLFPSQIYAFIAEALQFFYVPQKKLEIWASSQAFRDTLNAIVNKR